MLREKKFYQALIILFMVLLLVGLVWLFYPYGDGENKIIPLKRSAVKNSYDVVVVGGDPEGVAAAVAAARSGSKTLLIDTRSVLGGLMTQGWLNSLDMNYGPDRKILNKGIFEEFFHQIEGDSFDVTTAANVFHRMVNDEKNLDVWPSAQEVMPLKDKTAAVTGVRVSSDNRQSKEISARRIIDATQDGDFAAAAGVPFTYGQEDYGNKGQVMAVTQVFKLEGISKSDWLRMMVVLNSKRAKAAALNRADQYTGANLQSAWGFDAVMQQYKSQTPEVAMRGLNVGRQRDGSVLINALQIYGIDGLKNSDRQRAKELARKELPHIVSYIRQHIPGFEDAQLAGTAPELYVRETRHIEGLYRLTVDDVLENRDFPDRIAFGSYPIDIQATGPFFRGNVIGVPSVYAVPFRSLVPKQVDNLLVVGRAASFDSLAHGSARVIPVGMATGQAAGVACSLSIEKNIDFQAMSREAGIIKELQQQLMQQGVALKPYNVPPGPETKHWAYEGLKFMRHYGMAAGGYNNNYRLDDNMKEIQFINGLNVLPLAGVRVQERPALYPEGNDLTLEDVAYMFAQYQGLNYNKQQAYAHFTKLGFWNPIVLEKVQKNHGVVSVGAAYMLLKDFTQLMKK